MQRRVDFVRHEPPADDRRKYIVTAAPLLVGFEVPAATLDVAGSSELFGALLLVPEPFALDLERVHVRVVVHDLSHKLLLVRNLPLQRHLLRHANPRFQTAGLVSVPLYLLVRVHVVEVDQVRPRVFGPGVTAARAFLELHHV